MIVRQLERWTSLWQRFISLHLLGEIRFFSRNSYYFFASWYSWWNLLHQLRYTKLINCKYWDICHINCCRISSFNSIIVMNAGGFFRNLFWLTQAIIWKKHRFHRRAVFRFKYISSTHKTQDLAILSTWKDAIPNRRERSLRLPPWLVKKPLRTLAFFFTSHVPEGQQPERIKERSIPIAHQATPGFHLAVKLPKLSELTQTQSPEKNQVCKRCLEFECYFSLTSWQSLAFIMILWYS